MNTPEKITWADNEMRRILQSITAPVALGILRRLGGVGEPPLYTQSEAILEFGLGYAPQPDNDRQAVKS